MGKRWAREGELDKGLNVWLHGASCSAETP